jgi:UDP-N-acetylmuramoyl-L-alanyl-D-glutamate--2,6-diaminopimelate ligase
MVNLQKILGRFLPDQVPGDVQVADLTLDSRQVGEGSLFIAVPGHAVDGRDYIDQALQAGAVAALAESESSSSVEQRSHGLVVWVAGLSECLSEIAANFFAHPGHKLTAVAVTGTNGKSSVCYMLAQLCERLGETAGIIGTLGYGRPGELQQTANTTPDAVSVQRTLRDFADKRYKWAALETSSHGLLQHRVDAVPFRYRVFTNLTRDHLDYHGDMSAYRDAKWRLFQLPGEGIAVINAGNADGRALYSQLDPEQETILFGAAGELEDVEGDQLVTHGELTCFDDGIRTELGGSWGEADLYLPLLGAFNVDNFLAASSVLCHYGYTLQQVCQAAAGLTPVPGRMELIHKPGLPGCIIDYAHTPDALEKALLAGRQHVRGQLWCVFGCGGDRDQGKRPLMGEIAEQLADKVIITSDNPRSEAFESICKDIHAGFKRPDKHLAIADREEAIGRVFELAQPEDLILIAGKGHEDYQIIGQQRLVYSDHRVVADLMGISA